MNTAYTNGAEQNTETGKRQMANFAEAAKGMGFALGIYAAAEKSVREFGSAQQNRTVTEVDSAWSGREGEMAVNLNKHDLGAVSFGMASVILAYAGRKEIKKAFVYGVKGLYKASKRTLSFAKKPLTNFRPSRRNMLLKTVQIRSETLCSTKLTNLWGIQDSHVKLYQGRMFFDCGGRLDRK